MVDDELLELVEMEVRELLEIRLRRRHSHRQGSALKALKATRARARRAGDFELARDALDIPIPTPERATVQALPAADRRRVLDLRSRHRGDRSCRARHRSRSAKKSRSSASRTVKTTCTGVEMFRKLLDQGRRVTTWACCAAPSVKTSSAARCWQTGFDQSAHPLHWRGVRAVEGRGRSSHAVLQQLPSAVLLPDHRRDRSIELPGREMVMPGDNVSMTVKLIAPIAMEEGLRFAIREGGRTVGAGVVAKVVE